MSGPLGRPCRIHSELSERELAVMKLLQEGKTDKEMAQVLGISPRTCGHRARSAVNRLGAANRSQAVALYTKRNYK